MGAKSEQLQVVAQKEFLGGKGTQAKKEEMGQNICFTNVLCDNKILTKKCILKKSNEK